MIISSHTPTLTHPYHPHNNSFQTPLISCPQFPNSISYTNTGNIAQSTFTNNTRSVIENRLTPNSNCPPRTVKFQPSQQKVGDYVKTRHLVNIKAFNVRTLMQIGQQASLAMTLTSLHVDICCTSETRMQDPSTLLLLLLLSTKLV